MIRHSGFVILLLLLLLPFGCGDSGGEGAASSSSKSAPAPAPQLLPALGSGVRIVLEAETGTVEPDMVVEAPAPYRHPELGMQEASGGKCVTVPKDANTGHKENPRGRVTIPFSVPEDGTYYIYPRVLWQGSCWNSFGMLIDGRNPTKPPSSPESLEPMLVSSDTFKKWLWIKFNSDDVNSNAPRAFKLKKGEHTLTFTNREDDARLDQIYVTDDPDDRPAEIMTAPKLEE